MENPFLEGSRREQRSVGGITNEKHKGAGY